ncbi:MAG: DUF5985 family protein [Thermoleophilia bacterium]
MSVADVLDGGAIVAAAAIALFFARFHRATGDRFFGFFALAFAIFAADRLLLVALPGDSEARTVVYLVRAAAFLTIIAAVIDKNRPLRRPVRGAAGDGPAGVDRGRPSRSAR